MKNVAIRWRFVNQSNPDETVVVHDEDSAQTLAHLLQKVGGEWMMLEERPVASMDTESAIAAPPPAPQKQEKRERRNQPRYMTEFRVILISGTTSFRTMSQDVSLGGMRLKKSVPAAFLKEKCIAYVSHKDLRENIEMVCHVISDPNDPCRIQFVQPNANQLKRLNEWLLEHKAAS